jgi:protein tyrosine phosphatase (PTP) superfamily phosphohydrolase (DUF442 family)
MSNRRFDIVSSHGPARLALVTVLLIAAAACYPGGVSPDEVQGPFSWAGLEGVTHLRHLWFSGQPDQAAFERARAEGISVVINLRDPSELEWDESATVTALGMTYYNVPVQGGQPFDRAAFERIEALVAQHHEEQVLVHCASSNRVGGWLATHLVDEHGMSVDEALVVGRRTGITKEKTESDVRSYLNQSPS